MVFVVRVNGHPKVSPDALARKESDQGSFGASGIGWKRSDSYAGDRRLLLSDEAGTLFSLDNGRERRFLTRSTIPQCYLNEQAGTVARQNEQPLASSK
jgi:hypothetical protein